MSIHHPSIALIAPYPEMAELAGTIAQEFARPMAIEVGDLQEGLKKGRLPVEEGTGVIISRGGTTQLLKQELAIPIVAIQVTTDDILTALQKIPTKGQMIGITGFGNVIYGSEKLEDLLNLNLGVFTVRQEAEVAETIAEARRAKVEIIGDKVVASHANALGYPSILIESGKESILQSFHEAYPILDVVRSEAQKSRDYLSTLNQLRAVLDSVDDQIVILDASDRIQSSNPAALRLFKKDENQIGGTPLFLYPLEPLTEMKKKLTAQRNDLAFAEGKHLLLDYLPIESNGERIGTLIVGRSISKLQQAERKIGNELHRKGHVARDAFSDILTEDEDSSKVIQRARRFGSERPFVAINSATPPEPLLESELFGYAPGAFTGARKEGKKGLLELTHGGTLLLNEIGELPLNLQSRLLRVIEEREVQPIGDGRVIPVEVRIIATSNRDLFYRLNSSSSTSLRSGREDETPTGSSDTSSLGRIPNFPKDTSSIRKWKGCSANILGLETSAN